MDKLELMFELSKAKIEIETLEAENKRLKEALKEIKDIDYRGNRHESANIAYKALNEINN